MIEETIIIDVITTSTIIFGSVCVAFVFIDIIKIIQKVSFFTYFTKFDARKDSIK